MRARALAAAASAIAPVRIVDVVADQLQFENSSFDVAVTSLGVGWSHLGGGCHASCDTLRAIADAGFAVEHVRRFDLFAHAWSRHPQLHVSLE